ncbi:MAG: hypothetical protein NTY19_05385 [Planctomycetota bacterium]|nr:hypothetical protein [Planctomycetota bacterium]
MEYVSNDCLVSAEEQPSAGEPLSGADFLPAAAVTGYRIGS